jgi:regulator of protease activity HflC (stomatin/prohibitin superfamily)
MGLVAVVVALIGIGLAGVIVALRIANYRARVAAYEVAARRRGNDEAVATPPPLPGFKLPIAIAVVGILLGGVLGSATVVPPNNVAVIENSASGSITSLGAGTYFWPFEPRLVPFVTRTYVYALKQTRIEIGGRLKNERNERTVANGVASTSNSPGQPIVYFYAQGWAEPNPAKLEQLHRRYGPGYADAWVEPTWTTTLKSIQGQRAFDYIAANRAKLESEVETALQGQLNDDDMLPIVFVRQLAIVDFDYDDVTNRRLAEISQREFERQQAAAQIEINTQKQKAAAIEAETNFNNTKRAAEAEQAKRIAEAEGIAQATKTQAQAEAFKIEAEAKARSSAIRDINTAIANSPSYLEYQRTERWDGKLPQYQLGGSPVPFVDLTRTQQPAQPPAQQSSPPPSR